MDDPLDQLAEKYLQTAINAADSRAPKPDLNPDKALAFTLLAMECRLHVIANELQRLNKHLPELIRGAAQSREQT